MDLLATTGKLDKELSAELHALACLMQPHPHFLLSESRKHMISYMEYLRRGHSKGGCIRH